MNSDALLAARTADVAFYVDEALRGGGPALELGCGTGRVAAAIAAAGVRVVGLDRDPSALALARARRDRLAPDARARFALVRADLRAHPFRRTFARVLLPYRVLQTLLEPDDRRAALARARAALAPGGRLVFDVALPPADAPDGTPVPLAATGGVARDGAGGFLVEKATGAVDRARGVVRGTRVVECVLGGAVVERAFEPVALALLDDDEIEHLLDAAGYEVEARYGGWRREAPADPGEDRVWVARAARGAAPRA